MAKNRFNEIFSNAYGDDKFPLAYGSKGAKVKQLQEALIKLGAKIPSGATGGFYKETQSALSGLNYPISVNQSKFNEIINATISTTPETVKDENEQMEASPRAVQEQYNQYAQDEINKGKSPKKFSEWKKSKKLIWGMPAPMVYTGAVVLGMGLIAGMLVLAFKRPRQAIAMQTPIAG